MPYSFNQVKDILLKVQSRAQTNPESVVDYIDGILSVIPESEPVSAPVQPTVRTTPPETVDPFTHRNFAFPTEITSTQQYGDSATSMQVSNTSCGTMAKDTAKQFSVPTYHGLDF